MKPGWLLVLGCALAACGSSTKDREAEFDPTRFSIMGIVTDDQGTPLENALIVPLHRADPPIFGQAPPAVIRVQGAAFQLQVNWPNPLSTTTNIAFNVSQLSRVELTVLDFNREPVRTLVGQGLNAGDHTTFWDSRDDDGDTVPIGAYYLLLNVDGDVQEVVMLRSGNVGDTTDRDGRYLIRDMIVPVGAIVLTRNSRGDPQGEIEILDGMIFFATKEGYNASSRVAIDESEGVFTENFVIAPLGSQ